MHYIIKCSCVWLPNRIQGFLVFRCTPGSWKIKKYHKQLYKSHYAGRVEDVQYSSLSATSLQAECVLTVQYLNQLSAILHHFAQFYGDKAMEMEDLSSGPDILIQCPVSQTGTPGRPSIIISKAQIETLIELGYNYTTIARMFGISQRTLLRRRSDYALPIGRPFTDISESGLDTAVRSITQVSTTICLLIQCLLLKVLYISVSHGWKVYTTCT